MGDHCASYSYFLFDRGLHSDAWYEYDIYRDIARGIADELVSGAPTDSIHQLYRFNLAARVDLIDAMLAFEEGELNDAEAAYHKAIERFELAKEMPSCFWTRLYKAQAYRGLSRVAHGRGNLKIADQEMAKALTIVRQVRDEYSDQVDPKFVLGWTLKIESKQMSEVPSLLKDSFERLHEALQIAEELHAKFPGEVRYIGFRAELLVDRATLEAQGGRYDEAERDFLEAERDLNALVGSKDVQNRNRRIQLGIAELGLGKVYLRTGRTNEGVESLLKATSRLDSALKDRPKHLELRQAAEEAHKVMKTLE